MYSLVSAVMCDSFMMGTNMQSLVDNLCNYKYYNQSGRDFNPQASDAAKCSIYSYLRSRD